MDIKDIKFGKYYFIYQGEVFNGVPMDIGINSQGRPIDFCMMGKGKAVRISASECFDTLKELEEYHHKKIHDIFKNE